MGVSAPADYEGKPVLKIEFQPAEQPVSAAQLKEILPVKLNTPLRLAEVRSAIERLYATGRYSDIAVACPDVKSSHWGSSASTMRKLIP
jgi:outer membrane protein assembly factor BamA